ncbi:hypothetical protein CBR_g23282 [Chara braunii]|uniref:CCHC-type domain-containing protein n=1 Tax=Chara braunii TaxID=69332 RepID=A0A388JVE9_CHABU|nr:hypothetical protein CBR_g23282 [Chara braunii]|eukprot:GBG61768.1 hypothetical protein CBR_g23282 [Chara braunii]
MSNTDQRDGVNAGGGRPDDRRRYRPPTCFACNEAGHYAKQCPNRAPRHHQARPSTSADFRGSRSPRRYDPRRRRDSPERDSEIRTTVMKLSKSVSAMHDFVERQNLKKEEKARKKREMKEAAEREEAERLRQEEKEAQAAEKARKRAEELKKAADAEKERRAQMKKDVDLSVAIRLNEMEGSWFQRLHSVIGPLYTTADKNGKKKVIYESGDESEASDTSVTQELSERTSRLQISEKRKRGPEAVLEDSPPMDKPPKRTPKQGGLKPVKLTARMTRARARRPSGTMPLKKTPGRSPTIISPVKTPLSGRKTPKTPKTIRATPPRMPPFTPVTRRALERLRYRNKMIDDLKSLNVVELQKLCKKEGIPYNGKIESILDIADMKVMSKFGTASQENAEVIVVEESEHQGDGSCREGGSEDVAA